MGWDTVYRPALGTGYNITDVLEFPSTLMEQRTLDARGVLYLNPTSTGGFPEGGIGLRHHNWDQGLH